MRSLFFCAVSMVAALLVFACEREERRFSEVAPANARVQPSSDFQPGPVMAPAPESTSISQTAAKKPGPYDGNAWAVSEGKRLYTWYNCVGCHSHGGGGMGPALMDDQWIYGSEPEEIHVTIVEGRPNGMPAFGGKIPDQQIWQIVAYVRSMSGLLRKDVSPNRSDHMAVRPSEQENESAKPTLGGNTPPSVTMP